MTSFSTLVMTITAAVKMGFHIQIQPGLQSNRRPLEDVQKVDTFKNKTFSIQSQQFPLLNWKYSAVDGE